MGICPLVSFLGGSLVRTFFFLFCFVLMFVFFFFWGGGEFFVSVTGREVVPKL